MRHEPVLIIGAITAIIIAILDAAIVFGLAWSEEQKASVITVITSLGALAGMLLMRSQVYSPATVEKIEEGMDASQGSS